MSEYSYYLKISVKDAAVGANETNFPVALVMTDSALATVANGGNIANVDNSGGASGSLTVPADFEVRTDPHDSSTALDFEVVDYTASTGYIEFWIELDSLSSSSGADIYACFGNPRVTTSQENVAGTWGNGYEGVWHLGEASGAVIDSVGNYDGSAGGDPAYGATGTVGDGITVDTNDYFNLGDDDGLSFGDGSSDDPYTIMAWGNISSIQNYHVIFSKWVVSNFEYRFGLYQGGNTSARGLRLYCQDESATAYIRAQYLNSTLLSTGTWHHFAGTYDGGGANTGMYVYLDGNDETNDRDSSGSYTAMENLGAGANISGYDTGTNCFNGTMDEVQLHSTDRDSDWISTAYENQNAPAPDSTFWTALGSKTRMRRGPIGVAPLLMA